MSGVGSSGRDGVSGSTSGSSVGSGVGGGGGGGGVGKVIRPLDAIFRPKNVAVIGATENLGSVGRTVLWNLISSPFGGTVFPVNPKRPSILGIKAYKSIAEVPEKVDLAVITTPAASVPEIIRQCVDAGVRGAIVISAGFKELGAPGIELERQLTVEAARSGMRLIGPNCLGLQNPLIGLNATFAAGIAKPGSIAFLSQSGALMTAILDWSWREHVGFSSFVSLGSMLDIGFGDLIDYLGDDPATKAILIYMESIGDARSFLSAAREVAMNKPIIIIKAGRTAAAAQAAASHTGSMTGSDDVLEAAFRRVGVLRVNNIAELFDMVEVLANQPRPKGPNLTILTNAGGPGVLATDSLILGGGELTKLSTQTMTDLNTLLPPQWSHHNPVDILGDAPPERYAKSLELAAKDPNSDGMLVILTPQDMTDPTRSAEALKALSKIEGKPVLASWMGGSSVRAGEEILNDAGIPTFAYPDAAAQAFNYMWQYSKSIKNLYQTPKATGDDVFNAERIQKVQAILAGALKENRTVLTEVESKHVLAAYKLPVTPTEVATTAEQAVSLAGQMGYPVVLKIYSMTITHKTDVGGVILNLQDAAAVTTAFNKIKNAVTEKVGAQHFQGCTVQPMVKLRDAYELILGMSVDPQFGPVLLFGAGGQLVELFKDRSLGLPPLNTTLARHMMERTKILKALKGIRGRDPINVEEIEAMLVRFSYLVIEQPRIKEIDINPLMVSPDQIVSLDARVILHDPSVADADLPRPAIRPYPVQYVKDIQIKGSQTISLRPISPEDEPGMIKFHQALSVQTVRNRYFMVMKLEQRIAHERLVRICMNDYDREIALVAECHHLNGEREIVGVGRLSKSRLGISSAEAAVIVSDEWQNKGIGTALLQNLIQIAKQEKIQQITAVALPDNTEVHHVFEKKCGFGSQTKPGAETVAFELNL